MGFGFAKAKSQQAESHLLYPLCTIIAWTVKKEIKMRPLIGDRPGPDQSLTQKKLFVVKSLVVKSINLV